tara:strand:+ start:666 stop:851 length:186 start_codon:yes stop_codon:yes gene_type:complete
MSKDNNIAILESKIEAINKAIADSRKNATPATHSTVEMAIEMLAMPELEKVKAELAELKNS